MENECLVMTSSQEKILYKRLHRRFELKNKNSIGSKKKKYVYIYIL